jgi:N-sulfoglucosamine sulfohydrolase
LVSRKNAKISMKNLNLNSSHFLMGLCSIAFTGCITADKKELSFPEKPNIILIIADDLSWDDTGAYGNKQIKTPNIDRLANMGMKFNQAFVTASSCSPSRSSIITGLYPHKTDAEQLHWPLPAKNITFVEKLKTTGYWTAQAGKWHLGDYIRDRFDLVNDAGTGGFQLSANGSFDEDGDGSGCEMWMATLQARPENQPFFLWLASFDPHRPFNDYIISDPHSPDSVIVSPYLHDNSETRIELAQYYDEIARLDSYIGLIINELEQQGIMENTLILFMSDNGKAFPRDKTTLYDGGIRTPWIVSWPAVIKSSSECNSLVSAVDIAPTFLELAGLPNLQDADGYSFSSLLLNPETEIRDFIFAEANWHDYENYVRTIRTDQFKYIRNYYTDLPNTPPADVVRSRTFVKMRELHSEVKLNAAQMNCFNQPREENELYDIANDPHELNNLAKNPDYASTLLEFRKRLEDYREEIQDKIPEFRTKDEFDRETGEPNKYRIRPRPAKEEMQHLVKE